jgi:hypothetical protein
MAIFQIPFVNDKSQYNLQKVIVKDFSPADRRHWHFCDYRGLSLTPAGWVQPLRISVFTVAAAIPACTNEDRSFQNGDSRDLTLKISKSKSDILEPLTYLGSL